jgi:hypothetical protein
MGFRGFRVIGLFCLSFIGTATARVGEIQRITVLVHDGAGVPEPVLREAKREASRVFREAGIEIHWLDCGSSWPQRPCQFSPHSDALVLHIVPNGRTMRAAVFGEAFLGEGGHGRYADVFYDRMANAGRTWGTKVARLLGAVSAHELGHLVLGSRAHSVAGIMAPIWEEDSLRRVGMGTLLFSKEQSALMRTRILGWTLSAKDSGKADY